MGAEPNDNPMRWHPAPILMFVGAALCTSPPVAAQPTPPPAGAKPELDADRATARKHFRSGLKLFEDGNFAGALAEFEASYAAKAAASTLENIATCLKALFRYAEAADTLNKLLDKHGPELDDEARNKAKKWIAELNALVGTLQIRVTPGDARLSVDGKAIKPTVAASLRVNVGEHRIVAEAPGYARLERSVRVAGGRTVPVSLQLTATSGFISVTVADKDAAIGVDGEAKAFGSWRGPVTPGRHYVQVYKRGFETFEQIVEVELGKTVTIEAALGAPVEPEDDTSPEIKLPDGDLPAPPPLAPPQRGWYAMATLTGLGLRGEPRGLTHNTDNAPGGGSAGVRAGYRVWKPVAVEALLDVSTHQVEGACDDEFVNKTDGVTACGETEGRRDYDLTSFRLGGNLRLMSSGEKLRFTSVFGVGAVAHNLTLKAANGKDEEKAAGVDPFFLLELGAQLNLGHWLLELVGVLFVEGNSNVKFSSGPNDGMPAYEDAGIIQPGIGLRVGWSEWAPRKRAKVSPSAARRLPRF